MIRLFRQYFSMRRIIFVIGEGVLIYSAVALTSVVLLRDEWSMSELLEATWLKILLVSMTAQLSLYFNDLYDPQVSEGMADVSIRLMQAIGLISVVLAVIYFLWPAAMVGRWIFFGSILLLVVFLVSWRLLYTLVIRKRLFAKRTILVGSDELASKLLHEIKTRKDVCYDIKHIFCPNPNFRRIEGADRIPVHCGFEDLCRTVEKEGISSIIVALHEKRGVMPYSELLECKLKGISIIDGESFYERITGKLLVEKISPSWLIFSDGFVKSGMVNFTKRLVGLVLSSVILVVLSPVMLLVAIAIRLDSPGPVFFRQERVGENLRPFVLYKFRSMRKDAEKDSGPVWATDADPRVTRVGHVIRKVRIDELPQLWNVLKGDMSFVGPRPERAFFVERLRKTVPYYSQRFSVKPGLTGWAQVKYPYGASEEDALEKLKYELYYVKNMSVFFDLLVIFHTMKIVLLGRGSR